LSLWYFFSESTPQSSEGGEWSQGTSPPSNATAAPAALPAVAQLPPEGFYPVYLPPGYGLPEPQPNADGSAPTGPPTLVPVYISGFAPYGYPPGAIFQLTSPGTHPPHPPVTQPPTAEAGTVPAADKSSSEVASPRTGSSIATAAQDTVNEDTRGVKPGENAKALSEAGAISTYDGSTSDV
jgi:neural Wiskott-Aldrich syndrome protein